MIADRLAEMIRHPDRDVRRQGMELLRCLGEPHPIANLVMAYGVGLRAGERQPGSQWQHALSKWAGGWQERIEIRGLLHPSEKEGIAHLRWAVLRLEGLVRGGRQHRAKHARPAIAESLRAVVPLAAHMTVIPEACGLLGVCFAHPPAEASRIAARLLLQHAERRQGAA
jgi:hypothetical protein